MNRNTLYERFWIALYSFVVRNGLPTEYGTACPILFSFLSVFNSKRSANYICLTISCAFLYAVSVTRKPLLPTLSAYPLFSVQ